MTASLPTVSPSVGTLQVNLRALAANYKFLQSEAPHAACYPVVKANAYGVGLEPVARCLAAHGAPGFFVAYTQEGKALRQIVPQAEIFVLHGVAPDTIEDTITQRLTPVLSTAAQVALYQPFWQRLAPALHVDTGLTRFGLRPEDLAQLPAPPRLLMSHLSCADELGHYLNNQQRTRFEEIRQQWPNVPASLAASDGEFLGSEYHYDILRVGAALYGVNTAPYRPNRMQTVITMTAPILQVFNAPAGSVVGYSATHRTTSWRRVAAIAAGYADGLPRHLSNVGKIWFGDYAAPIIGRVSMDIITCDVTHVPDSMIYEGAPASLLCERYTIDDLGRDAATIGYEILTRLGTRFKRVYAE